MSGLADCVNCVHASKIKYKDASAVSSPIISFYCEAREETMTEAGGFYCWFYKTK